ncbi:MAG TPA: hypothetical protein GX747_03545 [Tenericutes bacterium]|nr:hypothetical protein [Mycoplasmatota bacterium]
MTKIIATLKTKEKNLELLKYIDAVIIGIDGYSINLPFNYNVDEIEEAISFFNLHNKEVFVFLNKNFRNDELDDLKYILNRLDNLNINGIVYYDIAIVNLKEKLGLNIELIWGQEHMTTNSYTINYWYEYGVKYTLISSEITLDEVLEIKNNTNSKLIVQLFGYIPMFNSLRHVVKNYKRQFKLIDESKINYIEKEDKIYPIIDNKDGTVVYSSNIINAIEESMIMNENNIDYILLNSFNIEAEKFIEVCKLFKNVDKNNVSEYNIRIKEMFNNTDKGFLYKETIYKVKE